MQEDPDEPGGEPARAKAPALRNHEIFADDGHIALVEISERLFRFISLELAPDQAADIASLLDRRLRDAGHGSSVEYDRRGVADDKHACDALDVHERADHIVVPLVQNMRAHFKVNGCDGGPNNQSACANADARSHLITGRRDLLTRNMTIWIAAVYWALVVANAVKASSRSTLV
jgi:hypothetical protein